MSGNHN